MTEEGLERRDPDSLMHEIWTQSPEAVSEVADRVLSEANRLFGESWTIRPLLKKARLPRLAKALA